MQAERAASAESHHAAESAVESKGAETPCAMDEPAGGGASREKAPEDEQLSSSGDAVDDCTSLSPEHAEYLIARHGTADIDPVPDPTDADPLNWPRWKKTINLVLVSFHACMGTFIAASIISAYEDLAIDLGIDIQTASYLTALQIAILGGAPLLWLPLADRYGRRPIFLLSLVLSLVCNIGCAESPSYGSMAACRALAAFFISPAGAIGSGVVRETFFKKERARYMGVWTLMVTLGVPLSPFIFGFVVVRVGYRWIYWVLAITNGVQFVLYLFLGPETRYLRRESGSDSSDSIFKRQYLTFKRIDPTPFTLGEFVHPLTYFGRLRVLIPAVAYAMTFLFGNVLLAVEMPQIFIPKWGFDAQALGLQYLSIIIGSVIGEQIGGSLSDFWMAYGARLNGGRRPQSEHRLWVSYVGFLLTICGVVVFLVMTQQLVSYNVSPIVGVAIAAAGNQVVTTVLITYAVDCYQDDASSVGVFITFVRQIWGFIGPFWLPQMLETLGDGGSAGLAAALIVVASIVPTAALHLAGGRLTSRSTVSGD